MAENNIPPQVPGNIKKDNNEVSSNMENKKDYKFVLTLVSLIGGILIYILRGFAVYSLGFAIFVFILSIAFVVMTLLAYKKEVFVSLLSLIVALSACGSTVSLITSFIAENLENRKTGSIQDYSDLFDDFDGYGQGNDPGSNDGGSDYLWD